MTWFQEWSLHIRQCVAYPIVMVAYLMSIAAEYLIRFGCWLSDFEVPEDEDGD